jgi:dihydrofolate reductase
MAPRRRALLGRPNESSTARSRDRDHKTEVWTDEFPRVHRSFPMVTTEEEESMTQVNAGITTSLDGYIVGPNDGPGRGLGDGGERLHYWVFGGPWSYDEEPRGEATGADKELLDDAFGRVGAIVGGRNTYEAAEAWGGHNPFGVPFFVVTHRPEDAPSGAEFTFVNGLDDAVARAREAAGDKDVFVMGGADVIRQALRAGYVEELSISIAPVVLGGGKRLFDDFDETLNLEHVRLLQSSFATHITYRVLR